MGVTQREYVSGVDSCNVSVWKNEAIGEYEWLCLVFSGGAFV